MLQKVSSVFVRPSQDHRILRMQTVRINLANEINLSRHLFSQISANFDLETATLNRSLIRNCTRT